MQPLFEELRQEQRASMDAQGARIKLAQKLGAHNCTPQSTGTPGFGVDTPCFPGAKSSSVSVEASVVSSGVASPAGNCAMSPWILEAEAFLNGQDDEMMEMEDHCIGWGSLELPMEEDIDKLLPVRASASLESKDDFRLINDCDELEQVSLFAAPAPMPAAVKPEHALAGSRSPVELPPVTLPQGVPAAAIHANAQTPRSRGYYPGDYVSYWSSSHNAWMPARVIERRPNSVYCIDKQMKGCLSKVKACDLIGELEENLNVYKAFGNLDTPRAAKALEAHVRSPTPARVPDMRATRDTAQDKETASVKGKRPQSGAVSPGSSARASTRAPSPTTARHAGRVVRDDFSDDSD